MTTQIRLGENDSAEPHRCGSCQFYKRRGDNGWAGTCMVVLPLWINVNRVVGTETADRTVNCNFGCVLWQAHFDEGGKPVEFVQERAWHAGERSR